MKTEPFRVASGEVAINKVAVEIYRIPTDLPESDGTLKWDSTTMVLVRASAGGQTGIGYTYADSATGQLIHGTLAEVVEGHIREHMVDPGRRRTKAESQAADELIEVVRRYVR